MTEKEWLTCPPHVMLNYLILEGRISERKLRFFACACCRRFWGFLSNQVSREAVEAAELYADGKLDKRILHDVNRAAWETARFTRSPSAEAFIAAAYSSDNLVRPSTIASILNINRTVLRKLCLELSGPLPFRAIRMVPSVLSWNDATVVHIAQTIYEAQSFELMPILADALEEAGCDNEEILNHCRHQDPLHTRGCWVIDMLLGKE